MLTARHARKVMRGLAYPITKQTVTRIKSWAERPDYGANSYQKKIRDSPTRLRRKQLPGETQELLDPIALGSVRPDN